MLKNLLKHRQSLKTLALAVLPFVIATDALAHPGFDTNMTFGVMPSKTVNPSILMELPFSIQSTLHHSSELIEPTPSFTSLPTVPDEIVLQVNPPGSGKAFDYFYFAYSPNGEWLALGGKVYDPGQPFPGTGVAMRLQKLTEPQYSVEFVMPYDGDFVNDLDFSYDSRYLAFGSFRGKSAAIDLEQVNTDSVSIRPKVFINKKKPHYNVMSVAFSPVESSFAYGGGIYPESTGFLNIVPYGQAETTPFQLTVKTSVNSVNFSSNGEKLAYGLHFGEVGIINRTGQRRVIFEDIKWGSTSNRQAGTVVTVKFLPDNRWLAIGYSSGQISLIDTDASVVSVESGTEFVYVPRPKGHHHPAYGFAFDKAGKTMAYAGSVYAGRPAGYIKVMDISDLAHPVELYSENLNSYGNDVHLHPNGRSLTFTSGSQVITREWSRFSPPDETPAGNSTTSNGATGIAEKGKSVWPVVLAVTLALIERARAFGFY